MRLDTTVTAMRDIPPVIRHSGLVFQPHYLKPEYEGSEYSVFRYSLDRGKSKCGQCNTNLGNTKILRVTTLGYKHYAHRCPECGYKLFRRFDRSHVVIENKIRNFFVRLYYQFKVGFKKLKE